MEKLNRCVNFLFSNFKNSNFNILKSLLRGDLLRYYNYDDEEICAGYLIDLVRNNLFSVDELSRIFGGKTTSVLLACNIDYSANDRALEKYFDGLNENMKAFICADLLAGYIFEDILLEEYKRVLGLVSFERISELFNVCVNEVFGLNNLKRGINLDYVKKIFNTRMPYIVMISEEAGRLNYEGIIAEFFESSFNLRIGGEFGLSTKIRDSLIKLTLDGTELYQIIDDNKVFLIDDRIYDRFIWFKLLVNNEELTIADINNFIKNSLRVMMDCVIITGISLFDNEEVYVDDIPEEIKNIFISDKTSEMTMSVVNTFLPIMSKQYLLNLKNKLSR